MRNAVRRWVGAMAVLALMVPAAQAVTLRLCTADSSFYPYTLPDGNGLFQQAVRAAARELDLQVDNRIAPRARCLQDTRSGQADALVGIYAPERRAWLAYPMRGEPPQPDAERGLGAVRFLVYRRIGSPVSWDGQRFLQVGDEPVGVQFGFAYGVPLDRLEVLIDDKATSADQLFAKLDRGRIAAVVMQEAQGRQLLARQYGARIEPLETPFNVLRFYLIVSRDFQSRHPELVNKLWRNLGAQRPAGR
ncbi:hypothetical protein J7U46_02830 [Pelomonas sp. V22]|uniref:substrate-binding periplasmic protein n=1 Tax=Pelomonas sp. V22 TaxID=2822139 RepID=UPI0024A7E580|nr:hypothetical protein [Pelomonas sp. V22]MDI4631975.1 hypothetical protein [Pelomonas sp. V22]